MAAIDIDLQDLIATVETMRDEGYDLANPDSEAGLDGRAVLMSRLSDLGWLTPTERIALRESYQTGDGMRLLSLIGGTA